MSMCLDAWFQKPTKTIKNQRKWFGPIFFGLPKTGPLQLKKSFLNFFENNKIEKTE
jgi:hypothetical protein